MLEIRAPRIFAHAGRLPPQFASRDPREPDFAEDIVRIDLRGCEFVYPPAVLWCAVYAGLVCHYGFACELLLPEEPEAASCLKATGLLSTLAEIGVAFDDGGIGAADESQTILPLRQFASISEVENLVDETLDRLRYEVGLPGNFGVIATDTFAELGINAVQHAESPIDAFGLAQSLHSPQQEKHFACAVADGGIGIRLALHNNREIAPLSDDEAAIDYAIYENISGTGLPLRGMGLFEIAAAARNSAGRGFILHSGVGIAMLGADRQPSASWPTYERVRFPGALAAARIPL